MRKNIQAETEIIHEIMLDLREGLLIYNRQEKRPIRFFDQNKFFILSKNSEEIPIAGMLSDTY